MRLPPYVQVLYRGRAADGHVRGFRGYASVPGGRRRFGPTRATAAEAAKDAQRMRGVAAEQPWGGAFGRVADEWLESIATRVTPDTVAFYSSKVKLLQTTIAAGMPVERISAAVLREFVREAQERKLSARTIQHCRRALHAMFAWCLRRGRLTVNPVHQVEWPRPAESSPDVLGEAELASCLGRITDPWARDLAVFFAYTGLRRAEMARLRVGDVDLGAGVLWVRGKARSQSHPIPADIHAAAARLVAAAGETLVPGSTDKARRAKVAETFRAWQRKLQEPRWHPHALRHSVATIMLRHGIAPAVVQRFLRHASYAMTQRYVHMVESDLRAATTRLRLLGDGDATQHG